MYICPKCGKYLTWYMTYANGGGVLCGWKCSCGYDTNQWGDTVTTNRTITKTIRFGEREVEHTAKDVMVATLTKNASDAKNGIEGGRRKRRTMEELIRKSDVLETYADLYDIFDDNKAIQEELHKVFDKLNNIPAVEPNLLIAPETIERGSEVFIGEDIVVVHHDDFMDMQCKAMMWDEYEEKPTEWIPCEERLPSDDELVLVSGEYIEYPCVICKGENVHYWHSKGLVGMAWMPLPKPWKGVDNETD